MIRQEQITLFETTTTMTRGARFSPDKAERWTLTRCWDVNLPTVCYIGHNPSVAGHDNEDPTSLAWIHFTKVNGCGSFTAVNMYPYCSSVPRYARQWAAWEKNGPDWHARDCMQINMGIIAEMAKKADYVVACWGAIAQDDGLIESVLEEIQAGASPWPDVYCLGLTNAGHPKHPMARGVHRIPRDQKFLMFRKSQP